MNKKSNAQQIPTFRPDSLAHFRVTNTTRYNYNHALIFNIAYIQLQAVTPSTCERSACFNEAL